jgi:hypothetical protein
MHISILFAPTAALFAIFAVAYSGTTTPATSVTSSNAGDSCSSTDGSCHPLADAATGSTGDARVPLHHRPAPASCPSARGPGPDGQPYASGVASTCTSDSECTAGQNGRSSAAAIASSTRTAVRAGFARRPSSRAARLRARMSATWPWTRASTTRTAPPPSRARTRVRSSPPAPTTGNAALGLRSAHLLPAVTWRRARLTCCPQ